MIITNTNLKNDGKKTTKLTTQSLDNNYDNYNSEFPATLI